MNRYEPCQAPLLRATAAGLPATPRAAAKHRLPADRQRQAAADAVACVLRARQLAAAAGRAAVMALIDVSPASPPQLYTMVL